MPERTFTLRHTDIPKSLNKGGAGSKQHWAVARREKSMWEGVWLVELQRARVPTHATHVTVEATLSFYRPKRGAATRPRDEDNYLASLLKPLKDTFTKGGYLEDDTPEYVAWKGPLEFVQLEEKSPLPGRRGFTDVRLTFTYPD